MGPGGPGKKKLPLDKDLASGERAGGIFSFGAGQHVSGGPGPHPLRTDPGYCNRDPVCSLYPVTQLPKSGPSDLIGI